MIGGNIGMQTTNYYITRKSSCIVIYLLTALLNKMMIYCFLIITIQLNYKISSYKCGHMLIRIVSYSKQNVTTCILLRIHVKQRAILGT
jgi:hypothetical protein